VVFAGDVLFRQCTPMGGTGSYGKWFQCLDLIHQLNPEVIVLATAHSAASKGNQNES